MGTPTSASETRMAPALVCFTLGAYLGLARNVRCSGPAFSIPATPAISSSPSPSRRHPSRSAISRSFTDLQRTAIRPLADVRSSDQRRDREGAIAETSGPFLGFNRVMRFAPGLLLLGLLPVFPLAAQFSGRVTGSVVDSS